MFDGNDNNWYTGEGLSYLILAQIRYRGNECDERVLYCDIMTMLS